MQGVFKVLAEFNPFTLAFEGIRGLIAYVMDLLSVPEEITAAFREFNPFTWALQGADMRDRQARVLLSVDRGCISFDLCDTFETTNAAPVRSVGPRIFKRLFARCRV